MSGHYYNVAPRYTAGSPALVDYDTAAQVAKEEKAAYERCLEGVYGTDMQDKARRLGLDFIVEGRTTHAHHYMAHDLITHRIRDSRDSDPRKLWRLVRLRSPIAPLNGLRARVVAISKRTQGLTVRLEDAVPGGAWNVGDTINVAPCDVRCITDDGRELPR